LSIGCSFSSQNVFFYFSIIRLFSPSVKQGACLADNACTVRRKLLRTLMLPGNGTHPAEKSVLQNDCNTL